MTFSFAAAYPLTTNTPVLTTNTPGELMLPHAALAATPMHSGEMPCNAPTTATTALPVAHNTVSVARRRRKKSPTGSPFRPHVFTLVCPSQR